MSGQNERASSSTNHLTLDDTPNQQSSQSTDQIASHVSAHTSSLSISQPSHESSPVSFGLLTYTFLLPLVVQYLNDGDVVVRLLIVNKLIRRMLPKYTFKRMCDLQKALEVVQANREIVFSFARVSKAGISERDQLLRLQAMNNTPLNEVHYSCHDQSSLATIPRFVTHLYLSTNTQSGAMDAHIVFHTLSIPPNSIPPSVRYVSLCTFLDQFDACVIPDTVTDLSWTEADDQPTYALCGPFPDSLKHLSIWEHRLPFAVDVIPSSVTTIECRSNLLSVLEAGVIPNSVKTFKLSFGWDQEYVPKPHVLPDSVTFLSIAASVPVCFIPLWMPARLTHLIMSMPADMTIPRGILPATLTHLKCDCKIEPGALPDGVTHVELRDMDGHLCQGVLQLSVTHLKLELFAPNLTAGLIPLSVTHLELSYSWQQRLIPGHIPDSVTHLKLVCDFEFILTKDVIPHSVTHLMFKKHFDRSFVCSMLPRSLTHLFFDDQFNQSINGGVIPPTVTHLVFGNRFNQPILPGDIPPSVTHLGLGTGFHHELDSSNLPSSLTHLEIPRGYLKSDDKLWIPSSVTHTSYKWKQIDERPEMSWNQWSVADLQQDMNEL